MVLHHFGDSTSSDVKEVEKECVAAGAKTVVVAGDIAKPETAKDVSLPSSDSFRSFPFETRHQIVNCINECDLGYESRPLDWAQFSLTCRSSPPQSRPFKD